MDPLFIVTAEKASQALYCLPDIGIVFEITFLILDRSVKVGYGRRIPFRASVSRSLSPNRMCTFRYTSGSPETKA